MHLRIGARLAHYEIVSHLGSGGMGEVYRATDARLGRDVALKVLPPEVACERLWLERFAREAKSLAALDHPGIVTVFSVEEDHGVHFLTMQLVPGTPLDRLVPKDGFPRDELIRLTTPLADALAAAHSRDIVHRDIKPGNIMITDDGRVKILDFGLAKRSDAGPVADDDPTRAHGPTRQGSIVGTLPYMSPEQIEGAGVGPKSDIFSLGIVLYEMATGLRPFRGTSAPALMSSILREVPKPPSAVRSELSKDLDDLITRCLEKNPEQRPSSREIHAELVRMRDAEGVAKQPRFAPGRLLVPAAVVMILVLAGAGFAVSRSRKAAFVAASIPRIEALAREQKFVEAFELANEVERRGGDAALTEEIRDSFSAEVSVETTPPGAAISYRPFNAETEWINLGASPLSSVRVPQGPLRWRAHLPGYEPAHFTSASPGAKVRFHLLKGDAEMVHVPASDVRLWAVGTVRTPASVPIGAFLIDRREATNADFARFIAAGGYRRQELWKHAFREGDRTVPFAEAMERFRDGTGRPGPASWKLGGFPDGEDDLPVSGVSFYEAAAFAEFAGKELPTIYHWYQADTAGDLQLLPGLLLPGANYESAGPRRAALESEISAHGAIDMAGNVREWTRNASEDGRYLSLGGAWTDPSYVYMIPELFSPWDRSVGNGFRCIRSRPDETLPESALEPLPVRNKIERAPEPVPDEIYDVFTRFFDRKPVALDARVESTDESSRHWIKQKVTWASGDGQDRVIAWLYLPRSSKPPFQVMIQMAGASTFLRSKSSATESDIFGWSYAEYLLRGGRAVLIPVWKGSYERQDGFHPFEAGQDSYREHVVQWVSEVRQSVDYLESRDDVSHEDIGFQGISFGSVWGPLFLALEPRLKTGLLLLGGLVSSQSTAEPQPPELQGFNYAPRIRVPVLMMAGRYDPIFPYETSQLPLFRALGTPEGQKRHLTFPAGHSTYGWRDQLHREGLDWLDQQFGPVNQ